MIRIERLVLLLALAGASCAPPGGAPPPDDPTYDSDSARTTLAKALDAWMEGRAAELGRGDPPIRFVDEDFEAGYQLTNYQFNEPEAPIRPFVAVPIVLDLRDTSGRSLRHAASYQVALKPNVAVLRGDWGTTEAPAMASVTGQTMPRFTEDELEMLRGSYDAEAALIRVPCPRCGSTVVPARPRCDPPDILIEARCRGCRSIGRLFPGDFSDG